MKVGDRVEIEKTGEEAEVVGKDAVGYITVDVDGDDENRVYRKEDVTVIGDE